MIEFESFRWRGDCMSADLNIEFEILEFFPLVEVEMCESEPWFLDLTLLGIYHLFTPSENRVFDFSYF